MSVNWTELRDLAKDLATREDEASIRSSISRAYYAAYHAIHPLCRCVPGDAPEHGADGLSHRQVCARLAEFRTLTAVSKKLASTAMTANSMRTRYRQALNARRDADYDLSLDITPDEAALQLLRIQQLLNFAVQTKTLFDTCGVKEVV